MGEREKGRGEEEKGIEGERGSKSGGDIHTKRQTIIGTLSVRRHICALCRCYLSL